MKRPRATTLIAASLLSLSSMAFASEPGATAPIQLSVDQMDSVTAGIVSPGPWHPFFRPYWGAAVTQVNASPVTIIQIGNGNTAIVYSGNFSILYQ